MEKSEIFIKEASEIVAKAGDVMKDAFYKKKSYTTKANFADLVTETDKAVELMIINHLKNKFPDHKFIGEESHGDKPNEVTEHPTWVIDPIDGTMNFVHGFPNCCIALGLIINKETQFASIFNPMTNELFTATKGKGAFLNGKKITVSNIKDLEQALVIAEYSNAKEKHVVDKKISMVRKIFSKVHGVRSMGSACMNLVYVACGRADAYFEYGIHIWDFCAGEFIVREAGGVTMSTTGEKLDLLNRRILCAGTKELALKIQSFMEEIDLPRD